MTASQPGTLGFSCGTCIYWTGRFGEEVPSQPLQMGECRKRAPFQAVHVVLGSDVVHRGRDVEWPRSQANDWCGDYRSRVSTEPVRDDFHATFNPPPWRSQTIASSGLSTRSKNALKNSHHLYETIGDLADATDTHLLRTKNLGEVSLREIRDYISRKQADL